MATPGRAPKRREDSGERGGEGKGGDGLGATAARRMQGRFRAFRLGSQGTGPVVAVVGSKSCKAAEGSREALWPNDLDQYPGEGSGAL